jgi:hypothetical protein
MVSASALLSPASSREIPVKHWFGYEASPAEFTGQPRNEVTLIAGRVTHGPAALSGTIAAKLPRLGETTSPELVSRLKSVRAEG